jgi:serine/threonine protein kinase
MHSNSTENSFSPSDKDLSDEVSAHESRVDSMKEETVSTPQESSPEDESRESGPILAQHAPRVPTNPSLPDWEAEDPYVGKTFGNCRLLERINEGGSAFIYKALNLNFNLERVVKILRPNLSDDGEYFERFKQEAQLTARLDHPNILRVFDTGEIGKLFFIEMEFVKGESLRAFMNRSGRIREVDILAIGSQIGQALDFAHHADIRAPNGEVLQGILHRDIKPENIMLTPGQTLKLMDFGAAKPLSVNQKTLQGTIVGTPHYMSPEQINGETLDARSDFFSLGVVLYELCAGARPFESENLAALLWRIDQCKYTPLRKLRPSISPLLEELIEKLLAKKPQDRPSSAREIIESLQIALGALRQWGAGSPSRIPFSWRKQFPIIALVTSLSALALSGFLAIRLLPFLSQPAAVKEHFSALLKHAIDTERRGETEEALSLYELIPSPDQGGHSRTYLESRLRIASLLTEKKQQLTRARALLEKLRDQYTDPAIDAFLGRLYQKSALYLEARDRLLSALESGQRSVLQEAEDFNANGFKRDNLYTLAAAVDAQAMQVEPTPELRDEAIAHWNSFSAFAECGKPEGDARCGEAEKRRRELEKAREP